MTVLFCWSATAQNGVTVSNLAVHAGTVTFNVSWKSTGMPALWSDSVWVFVDYNKAGRMERLPVTSATATAGAVEKISGNDTGVRLIGNARSAGSFSATVQVLTSQLDVAGACAYASNHPPVGEYIDASHISFTGTSMYKIVLKKTDGGGTLVDLSDGSYTLRPGYIVQSFTDATGAPGVMKCIIPDNPTGTSNSRCGAGEITISALSASTNTVIDWYDAATDGTVLSGGSATDTFTPSIISSTTYYAQARDKLNKCVSVSRTPVVATVNVIPTLVLSSGTATISQTVDRNTPIADIVYTAASATIALSSGTASLPAGISGIPNGTTFTVSGTPSTAGTFNYTVTATHADGGCTSTLSGVIHVKVLLPVYSSTEYAIAGTIWSDVLTVSPTNCTVGTNRDGSYYTINAGIGQYSYECAQKVLTQYCVSPWYPPTSAEVPSVSEIGNLRPTCIYCLGDFNYCSNVFSWLMPSRLLMENGAHAPTTTNYDVYLAPVRCVRKP
jgi:hypothetical protein